MADSVLTVIAASEASSALGIAVEAAMRALAQLGARVAEPDWLAERIACDVAFDDLPPDQADAACRAAISQALGAAAILLFLIAYAGR